MRPPVKMTVWSSASNSRHPIRFPPLTSASARASSPAFPRIVRTSSSVGARFPSELSPSSSISSSAARRLFPFLCAMLISAKGEALM